jgi:hypothetical protein
LARGTRPLLAWGSADDISAYSQSGTAAVTSGVTDPFGGTGAYTVEDNDGAAPEYRFKAITYTWNGTQAGVVMAKQGTATTSEFDFFDSTAGSNRCGVRLTWSGGVPTASVYTGSGSILGTVALGAGWYLILATYDNVVAANANRLRLFGGQATATSTGTTSWYVRNVVLLHPLDEVRAYREPRDGSETRQGPSGTEEAWTLGPDHVLAARMRHIPAAPTSDGPASGWAGLNESTGINCGVEAMLAAGRDKQTLRFVPDRSACTTYVDGYLAEPMRGGPEYEENGSLAFASPLVLRGASSYAAAL